MPNTGSGKIFFVFLFFIAISLWGLINPAYPSDLQTFPQAKLISDPANDGDSFLVEIDGKTYRLRLYFVDCPETSTGAKTDAERVREQSRYFGLADPGQTTFFGNEAKKFTDQVLSQPFVVHTAFASAPGRSAQGRIYGFVTTSEGYDLGTLLVKSGLARAKGTGRETADGIKKDEMTARLQDLENAAMLKRIGIWAEADPNRIAELRSKQRRDDQELREIQKQTEKTAAPSHLIDINNATAEELQTIKGIGPVLAKRIIAGRPYKTVDDLLKVNRIGYQKLDKIRPFLTVKNQQIKKIGDYKTFGTMID